MGLGAKLYMRKGFLIQYMRKRTNIFTMYEEFVSHFANDPSEFPKCEENFIFFFISVECTSCRRYRGSRQNLAVQ